MPLGMGPDPTTVVSSFSATSASRSACRNPRGWGRELRWLLDIFRDRSLRSFRTWVVRLSSSLLVRFRTLTDLRKGLPREDTRQSVNHQSSSRFSVSLISFQCNLLLTRGGCWESTSRLFRQRRNIVLLLCDKTNKKNRRNKILESTSSLYRQYHHIVLFLNDKRNKKAKETQF